MKNLTLSLSALLLVSCGGGGGGGSSSSAPVVGQTRNNLQSTPVGQFVAVLSPLNQSLVGGLITGSTTFSHEEKDLIVDVRFSGVSPKISHGQYVRMGSRCPSLADDLNHDGYIDAVEAEAVYGKVLFPLDADLSSQDRGSSTFPAADEYGNYMYAEHTAFERFLSDLREADPDPTDNFAKLGNDPLAIEGRAVVIMGIPEQVLPPSIAALGHQTAASTLPVACGVFTKVQAAPGEIDTDTGLGDVNSRGGAVGGSNNGMDDGTDQVETSTAAGTTTTTNEVNNTNTNNTTGGNYGDDHGN